MQEQDTTFHFLMEDVSDLSVSELADALVGVAKQLEQLPEVFIKGGMRFDGTITIETKRRSSHSLRYYVKRASSPRSPGEA